MKKNQRKQFNLPENDLSLSLLIGIEGERYLNVGSESLEEQEFKIDSSMPLWKRLLIKFLSPPSQ